MPHVEVPEGKDTVIVKPEETGDNPGLRAEVVRTEPVDGNIRVRCPVDLSEQEVPINQGRVVCEIGGEQLIIKVSE